MGDMKMTFETLETWSMQVEHSGYGIPKYNFSLIGSRVRVITTAQV